MCAVQERIRRLGIKQVDLIPKLRERGVVAQPYELSNALREISTYPKAVRIRKESEAILDEIEFGRASDLVSG